MKLKLTKDMISLNNALPWNLSNTEGKVLFRKGFVINTPQTLQQLQNMELFLHEGSEGLNTEAHATNEAIPPVQKTDELRPEQTGIGPLRKIDLLTDELQQYFTDICNKPIPSLDRITELLAHTRQLYKEFPEACIAAIHFWHDAPNACLQPIYSVFLAETLAGALQLGETYQECLVGAALTANLGMFEFQDQWTNQSAPLTDKQKQQIRQHPQRSLERLRAIGVTNPLWLNIVEQHHERADGSGYPGKLQGKQILRESLILGMIDFYLSLVMPCKRRKMIHPADALRKIYGQLPCYDRNSIGAFVKQLGIYPPGTCVRLANGEIAVITRRDIHNYTDPHVVSVGYSTKAFFMQPIPRNTKEAPYKIKELYYPDPDLGPNPALMVKSWS